jgi:hypothetical protein
MVGFRATVTNLGAATFLVPNGAPLGVSCTNLNNYANYACAAPLSSCSNMRSYANMCSTTPPTCATLGLQDKYSRSLGVPMFDLPTWARMNPNLRLLVNGNWFDVLGPSGFPYVMPCTAINGYSVSNGQVISLASTPDKANLLDALVIQTTPGTTRQVPSIVPNSGIASLSNVSQAVGGFIVVRNGAQSSYPSDSTNATFADSRTAVGLSQDGSTMYVVVVQPGFAEPAGQITMAQLANYMISLGAYNAINLDNSGSSQFVYQSGGNVMYKSLPGDIDDLTGEDAYRPIPNFFGIY